MKKVYCINCKYYANTAFSLRFYGYQPHNPNQCGHLSNLQLIDEPIEKSVICIRHADEINSDNNCRNYKKLWYELGV